MIGKLHHIGYAVKNIEEALLAFEKLGYCASDKPTYDELRKVNIVFLTSSLQDAVIELVAPSGEGNPVDGILAKNGASPYHLCFEVSDLEAAMQQMKHEKYFPMGKPQPACAIGGKKVVFMFSKQLGIIELLEV